jgi:hypothetical protein
LRPYHPGAGFAYPTFPAVIDDINQSSCLGPKMSWKPVSGAKIIYAVRITENGPGRGGYGKESKDVSCMKQKKSIQIAGNHRGRNLSGIL